MPLVGCIDGADRRWLHGWVRDTAFPDTPVCLLITANDELLQRVVANRYRADLEQAGFGNGRFGFAVLLSTPLLPSRLWLIRICSEADGEELDGSPIYLPPSAEFDGEAETAFAAAIRNVSTEAELDQRITFLADQRDRLLQVRADWRSARATRNAAFLRLAPVPEQPRRALVIDDHGVPEQDRDGGSAAILSHMHSLQRLGYDVTFAAPQMAGGPAAAGLRRAGITICHAPWFASVEEVLRREANGYELVYLHRVATAVDYASLVRRHQPHAWLIYAVADLHHVRLARQAAVERRQDLMDEARRVKAQELWAAGMADAVITHSSAEAVLLRRAVPPGRVHVVAWSVPCRSAPAGFAERGGMAFIGNFRHAPNVAAALHLRDEIMPALQELDPQIECKLVGPYLPAALMAPQPGLAVMGHVADLREVFDAVRLTVAPLRFGAGLKAKVMESLAAGVPCVCSPVAAEGLDLPAGLRELVASETGAAVTAIMRLHTDQAYNREMARAGLTFARLAFSEAKLDEAMQAATGGLEAGG